MILIRCIKDVTKQSEYNFIEYINAKCLFKKGNFYMVSENNKSQWMATDEEDFPHIIADGKAFLEEDVWFHDHFVVA